MTVTPNVRRGSARLLTALAVIALLGIGGLAAWQAGLMQPPHEAKSGASSAPRQAPLPTDTAEVPPPPPAKPTPALVTRLERINEDGSSAPDLQRWPVVGEAARSSVGFGQFLRGLFYVDPGRYRVIVFILQDAPFRQDAEKPLTGQQARAWLRTGANVLPRELAERGYKGDCTVLVYEFASDGTAVRVVESRLTGLQHLEKSGVLATLGRPN
jgi:hypothetical protein